MKRTTRTAERKEHFLMDAYVIREVSHLNGTHPDKTSACCSNSRSNVNSPFEQKVNDYLQDIKLYKRINDDRQFGGHLLTLLFEEFWRQSRVEE